MLRPSDIAPKTVLFDPETGNLSMFTFTENQVHFSVDGATFTFHGVKNDTSKPGFTGFLPRADCEKLDPVSFEAGGAIFLTLARP